MDPASPKTIKKTIKIDSKQSKNNKNPVPGGPVRSGPAGRPAGKSPPSGFSLFFYCFFIVFDCFGASWVHFDCFLIVFPIVFPIVFQKNNYF